MGTNFYVYDGEAQPHTREHIGKRYNAGGTALGFLWAMAPESAVQRVVESGGAVDEYGNVYTPPKFERVLRVVTEHDDSTVGQTFC